MKKVEKLKDEPRYNVIKEFEKDFKVNYVKKFKLTLEFFQKGFKNLQEK
jgi:hypothetical protein